MKFHFIFYLLFLPFVYTYAQTDLLIQWNKNYRLKVNDFTHKNVDSLSTFQVAGIYCDVNEESTIFCEEQQRFYLSTYAYVDINQSWIYPIKVTESILKHEQVHFDICEISARKIRKELLRHYKELDYVTYEMYYEIINKEIDVLNSYQKQYDFETAHGVVEDKQKEWDVKIEKELSELEIYSFENYKKALCNQPSPRCTKSKE